MSSTFEEIKVAVTSLFHEYLDRLPAGLLTCWGNELGEDEDGGKAWSWFESELEKLVLSYGWTMADYNDAEESERAAFYRNLDLCSSCRNPRHEGFACNGDKLPVFEIIHDDGPEDDDEDVADI